MKIMDCKIGDTAHVVAKVTEIDGQGNINIGRPKDAWWIKREDIIHVEPRPLVVGDKVKWGPFYSGKLVAVHETEQNKWGWIEVQPSSFTSIILDQLSRAE